MKSELDDQNKHLLPKMHDAVDKNMRNMQKMNSRLLTMLEASSKCTLYIIIAGLLFLLIFQLVVL